MKRLSSAVLFFAALLASPSEADATTSGLLNVGSTGILCYQAPCPWRGIAQADGDGKPLWWGDELPEMVADAGDRQRIAAAWEAFECVLVEGAFNGTTLSVQQVVGNCS